MYGFFDVLFPLVLMFAIIFSILMRTKILGESKQLNAVVSFIISLFIVLNPIVTSLIGPIFQQAGLALIIMVALLVIVGLISGGGEISKGLRWVVAIGGILIFVWLAKLVMGYYPIYMWFPISQYWWDANSIGVLAALIAVIGIIAIVVSFKGVGAGTAGTVKAGP